MRRLGRDRAGPEQPGTPDQQRGPGRGAARLAERAREGEPAPRRGQCDPCPVRLRGRADPRRGARTRRPDAERGERGGRALRQPRPRGRREPGQPGCRRDAARPRRCRRGVRPACRSEASRPRPSARPRAAAQSRRPIGCAARPATRPTPCAAARAAKVRRRRDTAQAEADAAALPKPSSCAIPSSRRPTGCSPRRASRRSACATQPSATPSGSAPTPRTRPASTARPPMPRSARCSTRPPPTPSRSAHRPASRGRSRPPQLIEAQVQEAVAAARTELDAEKVRVYETARLRQRLGRRGPHVHARPDRGARPIDGHRQRRDRLDSTRSWAGCAMSPTTTASDPGPACRHIRGDRARTLRTPASWPSRTTARFPSPPTRARSRRTSRRRAPTRTTQTPATCPRTARASDAAEAAGDDARRPLGLLFGASHKSRVSVPPNTVTRHRRHPPDLPIGRATAARTRPPTTTTTSGPSGRPRRRTGSIERRLLDRALREVLPTRRSAPSTSPAAPAASSPNSSPAYRRRSASTSRPTCLRSLASGAPVQVDLPRRHADRTPSRSISAARSTS